MRRIPAICVKAQMIAIVVIFSLRTPCAVSAEAFSLTSPDFRNGGTIPERFTCSGLNTSPALEWSGTPAGARSLVLTVDDPDAPGGTFVHWVIYNLSPISKELPEGISLSAHNGAGEQGTNAGGDNGYTGPCPPPGKLHHYHFRLYALDQKLLLEPGATQAQVEAAMKGHVLGSAELVGVFER
jgi:Raf kinase inhibitor-like YbhB/YbcL family protein